MIPYANLCEKIKDTPPNLRAKQKGIEIAKIGNVKKTKRAKYDIEIVSFSAIENGVEVFVRAWDKDGQIGFGKDGKVDIERFRIINPPVLVDDPNGTIIREWVDEITGETKTRTLREDTKEAVLQVLEHTISVKQQKFGSNNIVAGKVGNTTTTVYPDANVESTSVDGYMETSSGGTAWTNLVNATTSFPNDDATTLIWSYHAGGSSNQWIGLRRLITLFDTSSIDDADVIDSATLSLYATSKGDPNNKDPDLNVYSSAPASDTAVVSGDFDSFGSTAFASAIAIDSITTSAYNDWALNASGIAAIDNTGISKLGFKNANYDNADSAPTWTSGEEPFIVFSSADNTGTTQDPKLVVEHSTSSTNYTKSVGATLSLSASQSSFKNAFKSLGAILNLSTNLTSSLFKILTASFGSGSISEGSNSPGTMADDATVGTVAWSNPDNAKASDNAYAIASVAEGNGYSHYLKATNFGFVIPADATINGILVEIEKKGVGTGIFRDEAVKIVKSDDSIGTENKAIGGNWSTTEAYVSHGASDDLWNEVWTAADINNSNFGIVIETFIQTELTTYTYIDHIRITVYYTQNGLTVSTTKDIGKLSNTSLSLSSPIVQKEISLFKNGIIALSSTLKQLQEIIIGVALSLAGSVVKNISNILTASFGSGSISEGSNSPGTMSDDATVGNSAWANPNNAKVSDNTYATAGGTAEVTGSHYLKSTNFGFSIPTGVTINGILVEIERKSGGAGSGSDTEIKIVKGGSIGATNKSTGASWSPTESYVSFGSSSDLWGESWTAGDINGSTFGVVLAATVAPSITASVDHIRITVYYTQNGLTSSVTKSTNRISTGILYLTTNAFTLPNKVLKATIQIASSIVQRAITIQKQVTIFLTDNLLQNFLLSLNAILTLSNTIFKDSIKYITSTITLTSSIQKAIQYLINTTITLTSSIQKAIQYILNALLSFSSSIIKTYIILINVSIILQSSLTKFINLFKNATIVLTTSIQKMVGILLGATIALSSGVIQYISVIVQTSLSLSSSIQKTIKKLFGATLNLSTVIIQGAGVLAEVSISLTASITKQISYFLEAIIALSTGAAQQAISIIASAAITLTASRPIKTFLKGATITLSALNGAVKNVIRMVPKIIDFIQDKKPRIIKFIQDKKPRIFR